MLADTVDVFALLWGVNSRTALYNCKIHTNQANSLRESGEVTLITNQIICIILLFSHIMFILTIILLFLGCFLENVCIL